MPPRAAAHPTGAHPKIVGPVVRDRDTWVEPASARLHPLLIHPPAEPLLHKSNYEPARYVVLPWIQRNTHAALRHELRQNLPESKRLATAAQGWRPVLSSAWALRLLPGEPALPLAETSRSRCARTPGVAPRIAYGVTHCGSLDHPEPRSRSWFDLPLRPAYSAIARVEEAI
jgi:hypothetical protein